MAKKIKEPKLVGILKDRRNHFMKHLDLEGFSLNDIFWVFNNNPRATIYKIIESDKVDPAKN